MSNASAAPLVEPEVLSEPNAWLEWAQAMVTPDGFGEDVELENVVLSPETAIALRNGLEAINEEWDLTGDGR